MLLILFGILRIREAEQKGFDVDGLFQGVIVLKKVPLFVITALLSTFLGRTNARTKRYAAGERGKGIAQ